MRCVSAAVAASVGLQLPNNWSVSHRFVPVATPLWKSETHTLFLNFTALQGSLSSINTDRQTDRHAMRRSHVHSVRFSCARAKPSRTTYFLQPNDTLSVVISATGKGIQNATTSKHGSSSSSSNNNNNNNNNVKELQKTAILGTAHILRKVLTQKYSKFNTETSDISTVNSNTRIAATLYSLGT